MKPLSLYSFPSHGSKTRTSGVDYCRIILPSQHLELVNDVNVTLYDPSKENQDNWVDIAKNNDIIFFNYLVNSWGFAAMGLEARRNNRKMVMDIDDSLWDVLPDNPTYESYKKGSENIYNFNCICREVDAITTTSQYLKNVIHEHSGVALDKIHVMPNRIDLSLYNHISPVKNDYTFTVMHFGSTTHFVSLANTEFMEGLDMIMKEYPNVVFKTVGALLPAYKAKWGQRYINAFGDDDLYRWVKDKFPTYMDEADVIVAPLTSNTYNICKSNIKAIEAASAKKPGCFQDIRQYRDTIKNGENGYLCMWRDQWYKAIKTLIDNPAKRAEIGENAYQTIALKNQMKDHLDGYLNLFNDIIKK